MVKSLVFFYKEKDYEQIMGLNLKTSLKFAFHWSNHFNYMSFPKSTMMDGHVYVSFSPQQHLILNFN